MKSATFSSLRVEVELREAAESVLHDGESLSGFIEASVRAAIERRRSRNEFLARGLAAREDFVRTGCSFSADEVHADLKTRLDAARSRLLG